MPMVNVSEKTLKELKKVKLEEQVKTLDGTIRLLMSGFNMLKMTSFRRNGRLIPILSPSLAWAATHDATPCPKCGKMVVNKHVRTTEENVFGKPLYESIYELAVEKLENGFLRCKICSHRWRS